MKKYTVLGMLLFLMALTVPSYGFLDYFFSGSASRDAIDNSALGDMRAWWTGNPGYQFNPFWAGNQPNQQQGQTNPLNPASTQGYSPMGPPSPGTQQAAPPTVNYYPQQQPQGAYGQGQPGQQPMYGAAPQQYQQTPQQYQASPQQYQQMPQQYQQVPQQYQASPQQYQASPQQYQQVPQQYQPAPQQQYQAPAPTAYQGAPAPQPYQGVAQQPALPQAYPAGQQYQGGR
jgi:hypothetical protein